MTRTRRTVLTLLLVAVGFGIWWMMQDDPESQRHPYDDAAQPRGDLSAGIDPKLSGRTSDEASSGKAKTPHDPLATFIARGRVLRGFTAGAADVPVRAAAYLGYERDGEPIQHAALQTNAEGAFTWALRPPVEVLYLVFELGVPSTHRSRKKAVLGLPGTPAPPPVTLYLLPADARVVGRVSGPEGNAIPGATVFHTSGEAPVTTAADGTYEVAMAAVRGKVSLRALAPGHALRKGTATVAEPGGETRLDFVLPKEFRVVGRVVDPDGRPLAGATVKTFSTTYHNSATTDENGRYALGHLDPGRRLHSVFGRHERFIEQRVEVPTEGSEATADLQLGHGVRVQGHVEDAEGRPLAGAELFIGSGPSDYSRLDASTQDDGRFVFPVVPTGESTLVVERQGFAPFIGPVLVAPDAPHLRDIEIVLRRGRLIAGRIVSMDGRAVPSVLVSLRHQRMYVGTSFWTGADGRFRIEDGPLGDVKIQLYTEGYERFEQALTGGPRDDLVLTLKQTARISGRVLDGDSGKPVTVFKIRFVTPTLAEGEKRGYGYAATWSREGHRFSNAEGTWDSQGARLSAGLVFGVEASAEGYAPGYDRHLISTVDPTAEDSTIRLYPGATLLGVVRGASGPLADTRIRLFYEHSPLRPYDAGDVHDRFLTTTDGRGAFSIEGVPRGATSLALEHADYAITLHGPIEVSSGTKDLGEIRLDPGGSISGRVADARGRPQTSASVILIASRRGNERDPRTYGRRWRATTDASGRFEFAHLPDGRYDIRHVVPSKAAIEDTLYSIRAVVTPGKTTKIDLAPDGTATIRGHADGSGHTMPPVLRAHLWPMRGEDGIPSNLPGRSIEVRDGRFVFERVRPGAYRLSCRWFAGGGISSGASAEVTVGENESVEAKIVLFSR